ncbi:MAG: hypothetical protein JRC92_00390 [Deltaproteobacteria bacterium]|nr:hypothetical protein [Deltaproteobacteria bacterium]
MMTTTPANQPHLLIALESGPEALGSAAALFDFDAEGLVEEETSIGAKLRRVNCCLPTIELIEELQAVRSVFAPPLAIVGQKTLGEWAGLVLDQGRGG